MDFSTDSYTDFQGHDIGDINCFTYHRRCPIRYRLKPAVRLRQRNIHPQCKRNFDHELGLRRDVYSYSDSELLDRWNRRPSYTDSVFDTTSVAQYDNEIPCFPEWEETRHKLYASARSESLPPSHQDFHHRFWAGSLPEHERYKHRFPSFHNSYQEKQDYGAKDDNLDSYLDNGSLDYMYLSGGDRRRQFVLDPYRDSYNLYGTSDGFEASNTDDDESSVHGTEDERGRVHDLDPWPSHKSFPYTPEALRNFVSRSGGASIGDTVPVGGNTMFTHQQPAPQATTAKITKDHDDRFQGEHVNRLRSDHRCETVTDVDGELLFSTPSLEASIDPGQEHTSMLNNEHMESGTEQHLPFPSLPARNPTRHFIYFNRFPLRYPNSISSSGRPPRNHPSFGHHFRAMSRSQRRRRPISDLRKTSLNQAAINSERRKIEKARAHLQQVREELEQDREKVERERQHLLHDYAECWAMRSRLKQHHEELRMGNQKLEEAWEDLRRNRMHGSGKGRPWGQSWKPPNPSGYRGYGARPTFTRCGNYHEADLSDFEDWNSPGQRYPRPQDAVAAAKALRTYTVAWRASPTPPPVTWPTSSLTPASLLILRPLISRIPETWIRDANSKRHEITKYNTIAFFASAFALDIIVTWPRDKEEEYEIKIPGLETVESGVLGKMKECVGEEVKRWHQDKSDLWGLCEGERELAFAIFEGCIELRKRVRDEVERRRVCGGR